MQPAELGTGHSTWAYAEHNIKLSFIDVLNAIKLLVDSFSL